MSQIDNFLTSDPQPEGGSQPKATQPNAPAAKSEVDSFLSDAPSPARGFGGMARDAAAWAVKGAIAVPEAAVGLADIATGGRVGKALENEGGSFGFRPKQAKEIVNEWHSDATKDAQRKFQEADGIVDKAAVAVTHPSLVIGAVAESLPSVTTGSVVARGALAASRAGLLGKAATAGAETVKGAAIAGAAGEGAVMAGSQASSIRQETEDGLLTPAQAGIAAGTGVVGAALGFGGAKLAERLGIGNAETMLAQGMKGLAKEHADTATTAATSPLAAQAAKGIPRQVIEGAMVEGLFEEMPQSVTETVLQNLALDKPWSEGLDESIVMGVLSGGAMGAGAAGFHAYTAPRAPKEGEVNPAKQIAEQKKAAARQKLQEAWQQQAQILAEQEAGEAAVPQTAPPDGAAALAAQQAQAAAQRQAEIEAGRAELGPDDEIHQSTGVVARTPSQAMGLDANAGGLTGAAALAVDTGASAAVQAQQYIDPADDPSAGSDYPLSAAAGMTADDSTGYEVDYESLSPIEKELYDWEMSQRDAPDEAFASLAELDDSDIPFFDQASNVSDEEFLRALGASTKEIADAIATAHKPSRPQSNAASATQAQADESRGARQGAGQGQGQVNLPLPADAGSRIKELEAKAAAADAEASDWANRQYKSNAKELPAHAAKGGPADVGEANEQRRLKAIAQAKAVARAARAEAQAIRDQGNSAAARATAPIPATPAPSVADLASISRKQIPDMTDGELLQLASAIDPTHSRFQKLQKAIQARGLQAQAAINKGVETNGTQTSQAKQADSQQQQARPASSQAINSVPAAAATPAASKTTEQSGINGAPTTGSNGAQVAATPGQSAAIAVAQEGNARREAEKARKLEASERWTRMTTVERQAAAQKATGLNAIQKKNVHTKQWADLSDSVRAKLLEVVAQPSSTESKAPSAQETATTEQAKPDSGLQLMADVAVIQRETGTDASTIAAVGGMAKFRQGKHNGGHGFGEEYGSFDYVPPSKLNSPSLIRVDFNSLGQYRVTEFAKDDTSTERTGTFNKDNWREDAIRIINEATGKKAEPTKTEAEQGSPDDWRGTLAKTRVHARLMLEKGSLDVEEAQSAWDDHKQLLALVDEYAAATAKPATQSTAPEHQQVGVDERELGQIVAEFGKASDSSEGVHHLFDEPAKKDVVRLQDKVKVHTADKGWMTVEQAKAEIAKWKEHAKAQGQTRANSDKVVLSLFDLTGKWSKPWEEAGYQVYRFDIQDDPEVGDVHNFSTEFFNDWFGDFDGQDIYAVLAACPCTDFAVSGARHFAAKDADGRTVASVKLVQQTLATIEYFKPSVWAIENPVGRIEKLGGLPNWRLSFDPNHIGDPYTKKTLLWGRFNGDMPIAPVEPTEGSKMHKLYGGKSLATKNARSATPEGFAYGFFMANNAIDNPVMAVANKYDRLDRDLVAQAVNAGIDPQEFDALVEDAYYDMDDATAEQALKDAVDAKTGTIEAAAAQAATSPTNDTPLPTEAQKEAGNYKKGHARVNGLEIAIENPAGTQRNPAWPALKNHYGYFKGSVGADKDHVDVFLTDKAEDASLSVFVVDQNNRDGSFDEHKVIMGAANEAEARATYLQNYEKGWTGLGAITEMSLEDFKSWVMDPAKTKKPADMMEDHGLPVDGMDSPDQVRAELQNLADAPTTEETNDAGTAVHGAGTSPLEPVATPNDQGTSGRGDAESSRAAGQQGNRQASGTTDDAGDAEARSGGNSAASNDPVQAGARGGRGRERVTAPAGSNRKRAPKTQATSKELQAEAAEEIKQASPVNVPGIDFTITNEVELGKGTEGVKYADNLKAIRALKQIEQENRRATPEEQRTLARYVGWGGLKNAFRVAGASKEGDDGIANGWKARVDELEALLTPAELRAARNSTTAAHFTSETVVGGVWKAVQRLGFNGGAVLEPSVGTGNFLGLMPQGLRGKSKVFAVEYDSLTARMAQQLYPNQTILHTGFQNVPLPSGKFALAIGNPPFGKESLYFKHNPLLQGKSIHNQFFMQSLQSLADGGVMGMVVSHNLMDAQDQAARLSMATDAEFMGAIRLPDTAFKENARTDVVTDMLFFKKRSLSDVRLATVAATKLRNGKLDTKALENLSAGMPDAVASNQARVQAIIANMEQWVPSSKQANFAGSGETVSLNPYFLHNPKMVLGTMDASGTMNGRPDLNVRLDNPADMARLMDEAIAQLPQTAPVDAVAERTLAQFDQMGTAMRLAVNRAEPGAVTRTPDGVLKIVVEMDDVNSDNRKALLSELTLTANTPFSEDYTLRSDGKWQRQEDVLGEDGKPVKKVSKLGKVTNQNEKQITTYDNLANIPAKDQWGAKRVELITDMLPLRDAFKRQMMLEASDAPTKMMEDHRKRLADLYKGFVKKHGKLHKRDTEQVAMVMPDGALVLALENVAQDGSTSPADILSRRVTVPPKAVERVTNASEAVAVVLAETGSIDIDRVAKLLGTDTKGAEAALSEGEKPRAFFDPETQQWEPADGYLSGLVRRKLLAAKAAGLESNVRALEAVQPELWDASQITPAIGSSWIPAPVYVDFLKRLGFSSATVHYSQVTNTFTVSAKGQAAPDWRASDNALGTDEIVQRLMNSRAMKVMRMDADKKTYVDQEATAESQMKAGEIANEFMDWAFSDDDRREQLVTIFNEKYNTRVQRQRDGSHLTLPGKVPDSVIKMRPWQLNAVWRGITDNAVLYDHAVGAGKTFTAIARAMERRRMGLSKKPMIVVPNHLVEQWAADVRKLYPGANILAGTKHDFEKQRRRRLFARIGAGDYDMVIVGHSSFGFIDIDPATEERYLDDELRIAYEAVQEAEEAAERDGFSGWGKPMGVAQAERLVKKLEERLAKIRDTNRDRLLTFEEMGVDDLTVDEAHEFKNLAYSSNLSGTAGMGNKTGSQKALDLNLKIRTLKEKQGTSVAFLTGTPISNSVAEMYLVLRNLMPAEMAELGFENFDAWRTNYVSATAAYEPTESGSLKEVTRLGREWSNMRSLMDLYYTVSDAVTLQDMKDDFAKANPGKSFPVPKVRSQENGGGDREMVAIKPNAQQRDILKDIVSGFNGLDGIKNPKDRNKERLKLMDRARKVSLDARAVDPSIAVPDGTGKIGAVVERAKALYDKWDADKGTQLIFLDRSVPKAKGDDAVLKKYDKLVEDWKKANDKGDAQEVANIEEKLEKFDSNEISELRNAQKGGWNAYDEIKRQLVAQGIPANEIRFVQEANTDDQKAELFRQVNAGEVRILLGSSPRMGAGTNVQERLVALHHVDVTWKPSDIEQREGRIVRQGNALLAKYGDEFIVDVIAYATEMTVDAKMWSLNATKLKSINGVRKYEGAFNMEFEDEESASMAEMAALATGNPLMVERVVLDGDIKKLEMAQRAYNRRVNGAKGQMRQAERTIEQGPVVAKRLRTFAQQLEAMMAGVRKRSDARKVTINGVSFTSESEADLAATASIEQQQAAAGKDKARYVVEVNGEKATSRGRINELIAEQLGDKDFEADVGGQRFISVNAAVNAIMEKHGPASTRGREFTLDGITINGMKVELDIAPSRWKPATDSVVTLVVLDADNNTMAQVSHAYESPTLSAASLRAGLNKLGREFAPELHLATARDQETAVERAKRDLPELQKMAAITFPQEQDLKDKRDRLSEVEKSLAASSDESRLDDTDKPSATEGNEAEQVVFSRGNEFVATPRSTQAVNVTQHVVNAMRAAWSNGPEVVVAYDMRDPVIPEAVRRADLQQRSGGATGNTEGFYYQGKAYVLASQMQTTNDVARVVAHEVLGHHGLRGMFGQDLGRILDQMATMRKADIAAKRAEYGLPDTTQGRRVAAEEVLAELAQTQPRLNFVQRSIAAIRTWLRANVPGLQSIKLTDAEIINNYILPARAWVERGGPDGNGPKGGKRIEPAMSRTQTGSATAKAQSASDNIMFSRAKMVELKDKGLQVAHTFMSHPGKVSLWDKTVGTMRHVAERYPAFKPVFNAAQQFIDDVSSVANEAAQHAPRLIPRVDSIGDLIGKGRKRAISVEDNKAIAKALFEGTLDWGRDQHGKAMPMDALKAKYSGLTVDQKAEVLLSAKKVEPKVMAMWRGQKLEQFEALINNQFDSKILKAGARFNQKELKELFNLNDAQISLYDEARATVDKSLDITARAEMLRILGRDWDGMRDMVMDAPTLTEAWKLLDDELEERAKQFPDARDHLAGQMHQLGRTLGKAQELMDHGYMPLQRFGKYTVDVVDAAGERVYFGMFESKADSNRMALALKTEYPGATVSQGTMNDEQFKLFAGMTPETAELFGTMLGLDAEGNEAKDQAFQEYLKLAKNNHSAMKRLIHRKGTAGYSEDVGRVLASFVYSNARAAATGLNAGKMESAIFDLNTKHKDQGELGEIAAKLRSYIQDPQEEGSALRGMLFAQYLGGSLASAAVNMTQPFAVTMPWLTQYGGAVSAAKYMTAAMRDMAKRGHKYESDLAHALQMAEDDGVVSPQEIHQLMAQARGAGGLRAGDGTRVGNARANLSNNWERVKVAWGQPFALAEQFNRRSTFIASYRLAKDKGMENPAEFARRAVVETQFLYTKANKPQWARGVVGGTLFTFKTYSVSFLELMHRTWNAGEPGSPERAAGRRAVAWSMLMLLLMGGAGGMPFVEDAEDLIDGVGQMMGYNLSAKQWRKELVQSVLGNELAEFLESGVSGMPGAPIDISGRLGMGNLIPGTGLLKSKQSNTRDVVEMMGPAGDLVARGFSGAKSIASGVLNADAASVGRGAMEMMPTAVRNAAKGADMAASGIYKDTKGYKVVDTSLDEALWKAIGFQPRSVAQVQESNSHMLGQKSFYIQTSNDIRAQWAQALFNKDEAAVQRVRDRLAKWNENNPEQPIRIKMPDIWKRVAQMGKDRTARIADTAPTAIRQQLRGMAQEEGR